MSFLEVESVVKGLRVEEHGQAVGFPHLEARVAQS
jgi:hypothetical protein